MSKLILDLAKNIRVELDINERITFIGGDSGTGKTLIIENLMDAIKNKELSLISKDVLDKLKICRDADDLPHIVNCSRKIIFVDRYDTFSKEEKNEVLKAMSRQDCTWIIMARRPDFEVNYGFSTNSYKELNTVNENGIQVIKTIAA